MRRMAAIFLVVLCLTGCSMTPVGETEQTMPETTAQIVLPDTEPAAQETVNVEPEAQALMELPPEPVSVVLEPEASGEREQRSDEVIIDYSHAEDGYVMVRYIAQPNSRLKVLVKGPVTTYAYNLPVEEWTTFPLSDGDGHYQVGVYINVQGTKYAVVLTTEFEVELTDEFAPFLRPNQYVNYVDAPNTVDLGARLTLGMEHPLEKVAAVYDYVIHNFTYDYEKAETVQSGYLPELDAVLETGKGICFDYAAVMTAMLRSQQVPCKLVVGYAGEIYHSWISVWTEENGWIDGVIFFDGLEWKRMDPTFASSGAGDPEILDFIENGEYRVKYLY